MNRIVSFINLFCVLFLIPVFTVQAQFINRGVDLVIEKGTNGVITFFNFTNTNNVAGSASFINNDNFYVMKNYDNQGIVTYDDTGTTIFGGGSKQSINGGNATYLYNVVFDNPSADATDNSAFDVFGDIYIEGEADFKKGIVNNRTTSGTIIFTQSATTSGVNDDSYVNGMVQKQGDTSFPEFPIGSYNYKHYRFAGISAPPAVSHLVTSEYFLEGTDATYPHLSKDNSIIMIDNKEYWEVSGARDLILTLSWDDDTTPRELLVSPEAIRITRWDSSENRWIDLGGVVDVAGKKVSAPVTGDGIFTLALVDEEISDEDMNVYNAISPNDDGENDKFYIRFRPGVKVKGLAVKIFNRWGIKVYESDDYQSDNKDFFFGYSDGRVTIDRNVGLPNGTYFYILDYDFDDIEHKNYKGTKVGYLYIANDPTANGF